MEKVLGLPARRDAAFPIPVPLPLEELVRRDQLHHLSIEEQQQCWESYLEHEWHPDMMHNAQVVVMNRHTHEHQQTCAHAGKDGKGKGKYQCRLVILVTNSSCLLYSRVPPRDAG